MQLNPKHLTLHGLLQGRLFRIPDYQRAYAWETKQRNDLFEDIEEAHKTGQDHFMATIVCLIQDKRRIIADEYQAVDVVDGQQRLTTLIILLKAIEKSLDSQTGAGNKIKSEIAELLVKGDEVSLLLLQTNHDSSRVFINYIRDGEIHEQGPRTSSDKNIVEAARECERFVAKWKATSDLVELVAILRNRLSLIYHELSDEATVYRVFEVLNSRGLDVKWIDKLKSQLMGLIFLNADSGARDESLAEMHGIWRSLYRVLGLRGSLGDEALRFAGTMKADIRPNRLLSQEDATATLTNSAGKQLKSIVDTASWLLAVVEAVGRLDNNNRLRAVTRIVHARFVATAITLRKLSPTTEESLLRKWEKVTFRIFGLGGADTRNKVGDYMRLGYDIISKKISEKEILQALTDIGRDYPMDTILTTIDWNQCYDGWTEEVRYLLYRYDEQLAADAGENLNLGQWNKIWTQDPSKSIEHIAPQSSGIEYVHHIGNLTMLPPGVNSSLQDKAPADKASTYRACGIRGTSAVGELMMSSDEWRRWSKKNVLERARLIQTFVKKEWAD